MSGVFCYLVSMKDMENTIRKDLYNKFGIGDYYYYPLNGDKPADCEYFDSIDFLKFFGIERLSSLILSLGDAEIYEAQETLSIKKVHAEAIHDYEGLELIYCNQSIDWAIYFSHENTITIVGKALPNKIKEAWADWERFSHPWEKQ